MDGGDGKFKAGSLSTVCCLKDSEEFQERAL